MRSMLSGTKYSVFTDTYTESLTLLTQGEPVLGSLSNASEFDSERDDYDVQNCEIWRQSIMIQFLTAMLGQ
jgi:hypothetical protein